MVLEEILDVERLKEYLDLIVKRNVGKQNLIGWVLAKDIQRKKLLEIGDKYSPAMTQGICLNQSVKRYPFSLNQDKFLLEQKEMLFQQVMP